MRITPTTSLAAYLLICLAGLSPGFGQSKTRKAEKPNVLIITVDDMNCDSMGIYGCPLSDATPNMDAFARTAMRFEYAHVQVGNCMPSRNVMWSGRYPHNNRVEGFYQVPDADYPVLCGLAKQAGYLTAIRHKIAHSTPYTPFGWDLELDQLPGGGKAHVKDAKSYGDSLRRVVQAARRVEKPFCAIINISDPHKPFYSQVKNGPDPHVPTRIFTAEDVPVPGFLPDDPVVKQELALYYSSVRRADDGVGAVLEVLDENDLTHNTFVMFLSDHGMPLPFAKTQLYHHSTRTPLVIRWPGVTKANSLDSEHMVSAVDFLPTLAEVMHFPLPDGLDGRSFAPLLKGDSQANRDFVIKEYNENSGAKRNPMRAIQTKQYLYLFNPWSNGSRLMATATNGTATWKRMKELAQSDSSVAARVALMEHRVVEELYDVADDPDCRHNLVSDPAYANVAERLRSQLLAQMQRTNDPIAELLPMRNRPETLEAFMSEVQEEADARRKARRRKQAGQRKAKT
jgi:N-sulfoglucosamine sulfohydrolase